MALNYDQARVERVIEDFGKQLRPQDYGGHVKHGGYVDRKPTLEHAMSECADLWNYLHVHRDHKNEAVDALRDALRHWEERPVEARSDVQSALNLLTIGNVEGVPEQEDEPCPF